MNQKFIFIVFGIMLILFSILFIGLYRDDEFNELRAFTKHRPTTKMYFYSPIGMQPLNIEDLTPEKRVEQLAFNEFIIGNKIQFSRDKLWFIPPLLIQLSLTLLTFGLFITLTNMRILIPILHLSILYVFTALGLTLITIIDQFSSTLIIGIFLLTINLLLAKFIVNKTIQNKF